MGAAKMSQLLRDRYQILEMIRSDLLGETYLAEDVQLPDRPKCQIEKFRLPNTSSKSQKSLIQVLKRKADALQGIDRHPQIPQMLEYFEAENNFYLVHEFISGRSLSEDLIPEQSFTEQQTIALLQEIVDILIVIHDAGIVHGNLTPSNLIRHPVEGYWVLVGFGVFQEIREQIARSQGQVANSPLNGSALYVAPEQSQAVPQFNSDIYALGAIGIQALTGYSAAELSALSFETHPEEKKGSWNYGLAVSPSLVAILNTMACADSQNRYQLAKQVKADLRRMQHGQPLGRKPAVPPQRTLVPKSTKSNVSPLPASGGKARRQSIAALPAAKPLPTLSSPVLSSSWRWGIAMVAALGAIAALFYGQLPQRLTSYYFHRQGVNREEQGNDSKALESYTQALRLYPDRDRTYYNRGLIHERLGNTSAALEDLTEAISLGSQSPETYYQRGNLRFQLGDRQGALDDYTEAIRLQEDYAAAYVNRGSVHADLGDDQRAVTDYTKALEIDSTLAAAYLNRCLSRSNLGDHLGAIEDCTQAIHFQPTHTFAYQNRGLARRRLSDFQGAISDYNTAIQLDPDDADPYYNRGLARQDLDDVAGAIADFTTAINRNPQHVLAYYDRGLAQAKRGNQQEAIADFQQTSTLCLELSRLGCYEDAQYQLSQLEEQEEGE